MLTATLFGALSLGGASVAGTAPEPRLLGLVVTKAGNPPAVALAWLDPATLRPISRRVALDAFYPFGTPSVRSPDGRLVAVAVYDKVFVIDVRRLVLIWTAQVPERRLGGSVPIRVLSWPSSRRLLAASVYSELAVFDPVGRTVRLVEERDLLAARRTAAGLTLLSGRLGEPLRISSVGAQRRTLVLKSLWLGLEEKPRGRRGLPPQARSGLDSAVRAAAAHAGVPEQRVGRRAVVPEVWPTSRLGCGRGGANVTVKGYRILLFAGGNTYDYRAPAEGGKSEARFCRVRTTGKLRIPGNDLLRAGASVAQVTDVALASDPAGTRAFVLTSGGLLGVAELRSGRIHYRRLRPAIVGESGYGVGYLAPGMLVAGAAQLSGYPPVETKTVMLVDSETGRGRYISRGACHSTVRLGVVVLFGPSCGRVEVFDRHGRRFDALNGRRVLAVTVTKSSLYALSDGDAVHVVDRRTARLVRTVVFDGALLVER